MDATVRGGDWRRATDDWDWRSSQERDASQEQTDSSVVLTLPVVGTWKGCSVLARK
jgi:hypothetical protein